MLPGVYILPGFYKMLYFYLFFARISCLAVEAAVQLGLLVRQIENMVESLLDRRDAAGVLAADHVDDPLRKGETLFLDDLVVLDDVHGDVVVDVAQDVKVQIVDRAGDLDDVLAPHLVRGGVFDDRDRAVELAELKVSVDGHRIAGLDVVENKTLLKRAD